jgi:hypothetical protein
VSRVFILNDLLLMLFVSMYLGTGWSLVLFSFQIAPRLTVDNYYLQFVPQVTAATRFFAVMTTLMIVSAAVMVLSLWGTALAWLPVLVIAGVIAATLLTVIWILPLNNQMSAGIKDPTLLHSIIGRWMALNRVRVGIWTVEWLAMAAFFGIKSQ